jgi:hypothetical protein
MVLPVWYCGIAGNIPVRLPTEKDQYDVVKVALKHNMWFCQGTSSQQFRRCDS